MINQNNPALTQLYQVLCVLRGQLATHQNHRYIHHLEKKGYINISQRLILYIAKKYDLPRDHLVDSFDKFVYENQYQFINDNFCHRIDTIKDASPDDVYVNSTWQLNDLNQVVGVLTPIDTNKLL